MIFDCFLKIHSVHIVAVNSTMKYAKRNNMFPQDHNSSIYTNIVTYSNI